jgi:hypothetical protein
VPPPTTRELLCRSSKRVGHLHSSTRRSAPAFHRVCHTRRSHASPVLHAALRHRFHGSARLILAVLGRVEGTAKGIAASVCRLRSCHPGRQPNTRCSRPPSRCDFSSWRVPTAFLLHTAVLHGRPAELLRWAGGFLGVLLQFGSSALASSGNERELLCSSPNRVGHLLSSTPRGAPATHRLPVTHIADASPLLGLALRLWLHGSPRLILAVLGRVEGAAKVVAGGVCRPRSCHPSRSAQPSLQPTALSLRFSTTACADCRLALHVTTRRAAG